MDRKKELKENGDILLTALIDDAAVRVFAISGAEIVREARRIHDLSRVATAALGRMLMMTALMSADLKNVSDRISAIIKGGGPGGNLVCCGTPDLCVKGTVGNPNVELKLKENGKLDVGGFVGRDGSLTVVKDLSMKDPYVGSTHLVSGEIAEDFAQYYLTSEQQPSIVYLGVRENAETGEVRAAGGIIVSPLPGCPDETIEKLTALAPQIATLAKRLDDGETLQTVIDNIFVGMNPVIVSTRRPQYRCDCSRERIEKALIAVGAEELNDMIHEDHGAEVTCHFCNKTYRFTELQLKTLLLCAQPGGNA